MTAAGVESIQRIDTPIETPPSPLPHGRFAVGGACAALTLAGLSIARFGLSAEGAIAVGIVAVLAILSAVDLERRALPNVILLPATALVLAARLATEPGAAWRWTAGALGAGMFFFVAAVIKPGGLGMGDVKLAAFLGAALGTAVVGALLIGLLAAGLTGLGIVLLQGTSARRTAIPLGPFLALGAVVVLLAGG